jgi:nucleotide-binding universal stress UspA family protein
MARLYTSIDQAARRDARDYLEGITSRLKAEGFREVTRALVFGDPGPAITTHCKEWGADLVVMSTHGHGAMARAWLGSVADHVVRSVDVPVLLLRPGKKVPPGAIPQGGEILVPLDGTALGEAALGPAAEFAKLLSAKLSLVQVVTPATLGVGAPIPLTGGHVERLMVAWTEQARVYLERTAARLEASGLRVPTEVVVGPSLAGTVLDLAARKGVRMVALATHGRGGVRRLLLGSVADKVARGADCPVLVCRPKQPGHALPRAAGSRN